MISRDGPVQVEGRFRSSDIRVPPLLSGPFCVNDQSSIIPQIPAHGESQFGREPGGVDVEIIYHVGFQFGGIFGLLEILPGGHGNERQQDGVNHSYNSDDKPSNIVVRSPELRRNETMETGQSKQANRYRSKDDNRAAEPSRGAIDPITQAVHNNEST